MPYMYITVTLKKEYSDPLLRSDYEYDILSQCVSDASACVEQSCEPWKVTADQSQSLGTRF